MHFMHILSPVSLYFWMFQSYSSRHYEQMSSFFLTLCVCSSVSGRYLENWLIRPHSSKLTREISVRRRGGKNCFVQQQFRSKWYLSLWSMYQNKGMALFLRDSLPSIIRYFSLSPYFGTNIGSIAYNRLPASPWAGRCFCVYFSSFTSFAMHISLRFTFPDSNFLEYDKISYFTLLKSRVSMSLFKISVIALVVKGSPSLRTVSSPLPQYLAGLQAVSQLFPQYLFFETRKRDQQDFQYFISIGYGNILVISNANCLPISKVWLILQVGR